MMEKDEDENGTEDGDDARDEENRKRNMKEKLMKEEEDDNDINKVSPIFVVAIQVSSYRSEWGRITMEY